MFVPVCLSVFNRERAENDREWRYRGYGKNVIKIYWIKTYFTCKGILPVCMSVYHFVLGAHGDLKRASDPLELKLYF